MEPQKRFEPVRIYQLTNRQHLKLLQLLIDKLNLIIYEDQTYKFHDSEGELRLCRSDEHPDNIP